MWWDAGRDNLKPLVLLYLYLKAYVFIKLSKSNVFIKLSKSKRKRSDSLPSCRRKSYCCLLAKYGMSPTDLPQNVQEGPFYFCEIVLSNILLRSFLSRLVPTVPEGRLGKLRQHRPGFRTWNLSRKPLQWPDPSNNRCRICFLLYWSDNK